MATFAVRVRSYAAAHFEWDDLLSVTFPASRAFYQSEYTGGDAGRAYPITIHGEIRGDAQNIADAEQRLGATIRTPLPIIALAANAAIADALSVASYALDLAEPQPYIGYQTPGPDEWFPTGKRRIDKEATFALVSAVGRQSHAELYLRAIEAYRRALGHWTPEELLLAGEFLYISAETLSRFLVERDAEARTITPKNLARARGATSANDLRARYLQSEIFGGDDAARDAMTDASNGFEHGYMSVDEVRNLLQGGVLERSMRLVREALIAASQIADPMRSRLLARTYEEPRGLVPPFQFVRGTLTADDPSNHPALDGGAIDLDWTAMRPVVRVAPDGEVEFEFPTSVHVRRFPKGFKLHIAQSGMRAAHLKRVSGTRDDPEGSDDSPTVRRTTGGL